MADILIRGMEMPEYCYECPCHNGESGYCQAYKSGYLYSIERPAKCPLVPLQEGHGRLIDADDLVSKYTEEINELKERAKIHEKEGRLYMFRACHLRAAYLAEAKLNIEADPTIVPAEGGTDDVRCL